MGKTLGPAVIGLTCLGIGVGLGMVAVMQGWFGLRGAAEITAEPAKKPLPASKVLKTACLRPLPCGDEFRQHESEWQRGT